MMEVEVRGKISGSFDEALSMMHEKTKFVKTKKRISLIYLRNGFVKDVRSIRDDHVDLRVRITNGQATLVMKHGAWGGSDVRREIEIPIENEKFEDTVELLHILGLSQGVISVTETNVFDYKGVEFAFVKYANQDVNYFEAEKIAKKGQDTNAVMKEIELVCKELDLKLIPEEEMLDIMNLTNNAPGMQFDFTKMDIGDVRKRFGEYFNG
ncbi:MAG: CYTH domain-containing protein [archaeon]